MATATIYVAWWGAILATVVFLWDIYKWRTAGPKLRFFVQTGMMMTNEPIFKGKRLIDIRVSNFGDRPTTLTNVSGMHYLSRWARFRNKAEHAFVITQFGTGTPPPIELKQGAIWMAQFE